MKKLIFALPFLLMIAACSRNMAPEFNAVQYLDLQTGSIDGRCFYNGQPAKCCPGNINTASVN